MLISDLVTVAVAGKDGLEHVRDFVDDKRGCAELDAFEQRFADVLKKAVKNTLPSDVVKDTFEQKHKQILRTLENIDISDANSVPLRLCDEITDQIIKKLDIDSIDRDELQEAVETAYRAALDEFLDEMPDRDVDRWLLESSKNTQKKLGNIDNRLRELRTELSYRDDLMGRIEPFERIDPTTDDWVDRVAVELGVEAERELPFQKPAEFDTVIDKQFALLIGRAGLGKSRTLIEAIEEIAGQTEFDLVVVISGKIDDPADLDSLARTDVDDDVLLIWDDLHQVTGDQIVSDSIGRLKNEFDRKGVDFHVRGAVRSEHLDSVLPENWGIDQLRQPADPNDRYPVWREFEPVELESFDAEILDEFIRHALEYHNLSTDDEVIEAFVERVLEVDPTPFYVDTICRTTTGNEITQSDIDQLPESALTSWKTAYKALPDDGLYDNVRDLLHALYIVDVLDVSSDELLIEDILYEVFGGSEFQDQLNFLEERGWVITRRIDFETKYIIHDVRLEAIATNYSLDTRRRDVREISEFLKGSIVDRYGGDLGAILNANFADYIFANRIGRRPVQFAKHHFEHAVELNEATPAVSRKYAEFLTTRNRTGEADKMLKQAIEYSPSDVELRLLYIEFSKNRGDYEKAKSQYEQAIDIKPDDTGLRIQYAEYLIEQGEQEEANKQYEMAVDIGSGDPWLRISYAKYLIRQGEHKEAKKQYEQALEMEPGNTEIRTRYVKYLIEQDEPEEVRKQHEQAIGLEPCETEFRLKYARYLSILEEHENAKEQYEQAIDIEPTNTGLRENYAGYLVNQGEHEEARKQYEQAIDIEPTNTGLRKNYGGYLTNQGEHEGARKQYEQAINIEPANTELREKYAEYLIENGEHEEARKQYLQAIDIEPGDTWLRTEYVEYLTENGEHEEARKQYVQAIDIEPGDTWLRTEYAEYLAEQGEYEKANKQYKQLIDIEPGNTWLRTEYAGFLAKQGDHEEARKQYKQAIDIKPGDTGIRTEYAMYSAKQGEHEEAQKQYEQAIDIEPGDPWLRKRYAGWLAEQGQHEEARKQYEQVIDIEPGHAWLRIVYSRYLAKQGDHEEARKQYEQVLDIGDGGEGYRNEYAEYLAKQGEIEEASKQYDIVCENTLPTGRRTVCPIKGCELELLIEDMPNHLFNEHE